MPFSKLRRFSLFAPIPAPVRLALPKQKLKEDIEAGQIDIIVIYKIDRLTRSLCDFSELQEFLDQHDVSFVSVTQEINTSTSAGRMMLNILMTFAQYEREIIAERVRDKVAAAKKRGKNCGGFPILGYDSDPSTKRLIINEEEAEIVRFAFKSYLKHGSAKAVSTELELKGFRGKSWTTKLKEGTYLSNSMLLTLMRAKNPCKVWEEACLEAEGEPSEKLISQIIDRDNPKTEENNDCLKNEIEQATADKIISVLQKIKNKNYSPNDDERKQLIALLEKSWDKAAAESSTDCEDAIEQTA